MNSTDTDQRISYLTHPHISYTHVSQVHLSHMLILSLSFSPPPTRIDKHTNTNTHMRKNTRKQPHTDECQLQQCAIKPLECIQSNWSEPASATPLHCASLQWLPRYYKVATPEPTVANRTNGTRTSVNGTNGTNVTTIEEPADDRPGFLVHDPPCDDKAQW